MIREIVECPLCYKLYVKGGFVHDRKETDCPHCFGKVDILDKKTRDEQ